MRTTFIYLQFLPAINSWPTGLSLAARATVRLYTLSRCPPFWILWFCIYLKFSGAQENDFNFSEVKTYFRHVHPDSLFRVLLKPFIRQSPKSTSVSSEKDPGFDSPLVTPTWGSWWTTCCWLCWRSWTGRRPTSPWTSPFGRTRCLVQC